MKSGPLTFMRHLQTMKIETLKELAKEDTRNKNLGITLDWLMKNLNSMPVSPKVPKEVVDILGLARKLCLYGYFEYDFHSVSLFYACLTVELALRFKKQSIESPGVPLTTFGSSTLHSLSKWAKERNVLPSRLQYFLEPLRSLRNSCAHPNFKSVITPRMSVGIFNWVVDFINCLFDKTCWDKEPEVLRRDRPVIERIKKEIHNLKKI